VRIRFPFESPDCRVQLKLISQKKKKMFSQKRDDFYRTEQKSGSITKHKIFLKKKVFPFYLLQDDGKNIFRFYEKLFICPKVSLYFSLSFFRFQKGTKDWKKSTCFASGNCIKIIKILHSSLSSSFRVCQAHLKEKIYEFLDPIVTRAKKGR
jgi:hypothetical protein